jgi:hypothetical protein
MLVHLIVPWKKEVKENVETCQDKNKTKLQNWNQVQTWKVKNRKLGNFLKRKEILISCRNWNLYVLL